MFTLLRAGTIGAVAMVGVVAALPSVVVGQPDAESVEPNRTSVDRRGPTAGMPRYLRDAVCFRALPDTGGRGPIRSGAGVVKVLGDDDNETFVRFSYDDHGTSTWTDDELVVEREVYTEGADVVDTFRTPYWAVPGPGDIGGITIENTPSSRAVNFLYYGGSSDVASSIDNNTSIPMRGFGWFDFLGPGRDGYQGGSGPDCVAHASNHDDRIFTGAGSDYVSTQYGDDLIVLGSGADTGIGGSDDDVIRGGRGQDHIEGDQGDDCYDGGRGIDVLEETSTVDGDQFVIDDLYVDVILPDDAEFWSPAMVESCS